MFDYECGSAGEGAGNQKEASEKRWGVQRETMQMHSTQNILFNSSKQKQVLCFFVAPLKDMLCVCLHWEVGMGLHRQAIFTRISANE